MIRVATCNQLEISETTLYKENGALRNLLPGVKVSALESRMENRDRRGRAVSSCLLKGELCFELNRPKN